MPDLSNIQAIAARVIKERTGIDMADPKQRNKVKEHVITWRNRRLNGVIRQNDLFKNSEYLNNSLFNGIQRLDFTFQDWDIHKQQNVELTRNVGNQCYKLAKQIVDTPKKVLLVGPPGVGKTSLAMAMLNLLCDEGYTVMTVSTLELSRLMNKRFDDKDVVYKVDYLTRLMQTVDVLLLDDFGTEGNLKNENRSVRQDLQELLFSVANSRWDLKRNEPIRSTIITTNASQDKLNTIYDEKLISRLLPHNNAQIVNFAGLRDVRN